MQRRSWIPLVIILIIAISNSTMQPMASEAATLAPLPAPSLKVTPLSLDFGPVGVNLGSSIQTVTLVNIGSDAVHDFSGGDVNPPFLSGQDCGLTLEPGESCRFYFQFSPSETGVYTTTSNIATNTGSIRIDLRGEGRGAELHVDHLSLDFGKIRVGNTSPDQTVTIRNTGLAKLANFAGGGVASPFWATQNCAAGVLPGESCSYFFHFSPTATGLFTDTSNSSTNAGPFAIDLMGRGWQTISVGSQQVTPRSLDFGPIGVGFNSPSMVVTITNQSAYEITDWAGGGLYPPFIAMQDCASGLLPGDSCHFLYTFNPTETGVFTTTSSVSNSRGSFTIQLRGEGAGAGLSVSPLVLDFGFITPGSESPVQIVTIKNTGLATLTNFAGGGLSSPFYAEQDCAAGVAPGGICHYYFRFIPTEWGRFSAISSSGTNAGPFTIQVNGGVELPVLQQSFIPNQITPGGTSTLHYFITNHNSYTTLFNVGFNNTFPPGLRVAAPVQSSISPECGTPIFNATAESTQVSFSNATILGKHICEISINISADSIGTYENINGEVSSLTGAGSFISALLYVGAISYLPLVSR